METGSICLRKLTYLVAVLATMIVSSAGAQTGGAQPSIRATATDFERLLAGLPADNVLKTASPFGGQRVEPAFIFIPGILGSKLVFERPNQKPEVVWGCVGNTIVVSDRLSYDIAPKLKAMPLLGPDSPRGDCAFDVYKKFFDAMTYSGLVAENTFINFAYDWRQPNEMSAKDLDGEIRQRMGELANRKVVFVAHSMGGLVFKWWYFHHYLPKLSDYPFEIVKIFFVGTPHSGSYAAVDALKNGNTLMAKAGTFLGWLEQKIAPALNQFGLTFPSFYELLPFEPEKTNHARYFPSIGQSGHAFPIDLMTVKAWQRLGLPNTNRINLPAQMTLKDFYDTRLAGMLERARRFQEDLKKQPTIESARYAFSIKHNTPTGLVARDGEGTTLLSEIEFANKGGDGTVFADSAKDSPRPVKSDVMIWLDNEHAALVADENFIDRIFQQRADLAKGWEDAAKTWQASEAVVKLLAENNVLLPSAGVEASWAKPRKVNVVCSSSAALAYLFCKKGVMQAFGNVGEVMEVSENAKLDAIGALNAKILARMAKNRGVKVSALSAALYASAKADKNPRTRKERYIAYIAVEQQLLPHNDGNVANLGWAYNNLGSLMLQQDAEKAASFPLGNAVAIGMETKLDNLIMMSTKNLDAANRL